MVSKSAARTLALAGIVVPALFTTLVILQGFLAPDYSHIALPISALAAWPAGWIQRLNFYVAGTLYVAFAIGLHSGVQRTRFGAAGIGLLILSGIGLVLAGIFSWRMVDGKPEEIPQHVVGAILSFVGTGLGLIVLSRRMAADPRWRDRSTYTMATGIGVLILFVAVGFFAIEDDAPLHPWAGLIQRVLCAVWFTCLVVLALRLRTVERSEVPIL
jgi:hypothetical membrane protein